MPDQPCSFCGHSVPIEASFCPHCARPSLYPNVRAAEQETEREALAARHRLAVQDAESRGCGKAVRSFESAADSSHAVLSRSLAEVERLASSDRQLYATYYQLLDAEVKLPAGDVWDPLRRLADEALFPGYKKKIRFAALSLDGMGLLGYGECSLVLKEEMIAHRASLLEGNSALLMRNWAYNVPAGSRAVWNERGRLCVAKLAARLRPETTEADFASLLLRPGVSPEDDEFVEVHIWGPMSSRTFARVVLRPPAGARRPAETRVKALCAKLVQAGIDLERKQPWTP
jgi:hypothetical protein